MVIKSLIDNLSEATNDWVITHNGVKENSCGLVGLSREAAKVISELHTELISLKSENEKLKSENAYLNNNLQDEVFEILGEILGSPCDHGFDDYMNKHCEGWCGDTCGSASDSMCWKKLIYAKYAEHKLNEDKHYKSLDMNVLKSKPSKIISSEEALIDEEPLFTKEEVENMSPRDVSKNYKGIIKSIPKWKL